MYVGLFDLSFFISSVRLFFPPASCKYYCSLVTSSAFIRTSSDLFAKYVSTVLFHMLLMIFLELQPSFFGVLLATTGFNNYNCRLEKKLINFSSISIQYPCIFFKFSSFNLNFCRCCSFLLSMVYYFLIDNFLCNFYEMHCYSSRNLIHHYISNRSFIKIF